MKIKVWQGVVSGNSFLPGLQRAAFSLCLHMEERERVLDTNPVKSESYSHDPI